jgi:hypothetical protein
VPLEVPGGHPAVSFLQSGNVWSVTSAPDQFLRPDVAPALQDWALRVQQVIVLF